VAEHVTKREHLDGINACVSENGRLIIHTRISEEIPKDPNWFYLLPVHCAFHTNKSMSLLMQQWGYVSSIYCPTARLWVLLKNENQNLFKLIQAINNEFQNEYLYGKLGFMDYWKTSS